MEIATTDYHTAGEPFRIVAEGSVEIPGATVLARREHATSSDVALHPRDPRLSGIYGTVIHEEVGPAHQRAPEPSGPRLFKSTGMAWEDAVMVDAILAEPQRA